MGFGDILFGDFMIYYYKQIDKNGAIINFITYEIFSPIFTEEEAPYFILLTKEEFDEQLKNFIQQNSLAAIVNIEQLETIV